MFCSYFTVDIYSSDLAAATGNSTYLNNTLYFSATTCSGNTQIETFNSAGLNIPVSFCVDQDFPIQIYYYVNDNFTLASFSNYIDVGDCTSPTPTPTTTQTPTPDPTPDPLISTQTPTQTQTPTPTTTTPDYLVTQTQTPTQTQTQTPTTTALYVEYQITSFGYGTTNDACASLDAVIPVYAEPGNTVPIVSMIFYDDTSLTIPHNGGFLGQYFLLERLGTKWAAQVDTSGVLTDYAICSSLTTPTPTPTVTPTNTETPTPTETPTQTQTGTAAVTPTQTQTGTAAVTPTPTNTQTQTPTVTPISFSHLLYTGASCNDACDTLNIPLTVYTTGSTINVDDHFYLDSSLTIDAEFGYYSDGINCYDYSFSNNGLNTAYVGVISPCGVTPTPTPTNTQTPTQTQTGTAAVTPTTTLTATPTQTQTQTPTTTTTLTATATPTNTQTPTQTQTGTAAVTPTPTNTQTQTSTPTTTLMVTQTPTVSITPTNTPTPTTTPTLTQTPGLTVQFQDCSNGDKFRFHNGALPTIIGDTYSITGGNDFTGCATIITNTSEGLLYDATSVVFTMTSGCGDPICPRTSQSPSLLSECSTGQVVYFNVDTDTAFVGAVYLVSGHCYSFVEFSGPGGEYVPGPSYSRCIDCIPIPVTPTPYPSPTQTPTVSSTPAACSTTYCFNTTDSILSGYSGNYTYYGSYNARSIFSGDGTSTGYIYYNNTAWCLSSTPGGSCLYQGANPCYYNCPDFPSNVFYTGPCVTPTPTPINCYIFDFNAYFDCDWEPLPTPTPSVACDDVNFDFSSFGLTPTPSTSQDCSGKSVIFSLSGFTTQPTPTPSNTPTVTITRTVDVAGSVSYEILDETFSCVSVKVLIDCSNGDEIYVNSGLVLNGTAAQIGITMLSIIDGVYRCVTYDRDDSNLSSNANVDAVIAFYNNCEYCSTIPTPTQTQTPTKTPTNTPTPSITPSPTATVGATPPPTPTQTQTGTSTQTPTPSVTPNYVYVYESCSPISVGSPLNTQIIQTEQVPFTDIAGIIFKDNSGNCWTYQGRFESDYIAPPTVIAITYQGNYFVGVSSTIYPTCEDCETVASLCNNYRIENNTESSISVSWYDCEGVFTVEPNLQSGEQTAFCANLFYGPIEYSSGSLFDLGSCV